MKALLIAVLCATIGAATHVAAARPAAGAATEAATSSVSSLRIVFAAISRDPVLSLTGAQMIFTAGPGGHDLRQITPYDGNTYDWPTWAYGGTKIVYTQRSLTDPAAGENLFLMDPDGSGRIQLTHARWRSVQPKVSPDGLSVVFTAQWPEFPRVALFKLDLATRTVANLSAVASRIGARSSDPRWVGDGTAIVYADTSDGTLAEVPTQIYAMDPSGGQRRRLTRDRFWNTDPALSPDGTQLAVSAYRGPGLPHLDGAEGEFAVKLQDWHLVVIDPATGAERVLTQGLPCASRVAPMPACAPNEGPAWVPVWSPDGAAIGFLAVRSSRTMGIYVIAPEGGPAWPILESDDLAFTWWDWIDTAAPVPARAPVIGSPLEAALLIGGDGQETEGLLVRSTPDRWSEIAVAPAAAGLTPRFARWTADKTGIIFTARRPIDAAASRPVPPAGATRRVRYTLSDFTTPYELFPDQAIAGEQVYVMDPDGGNVRQLTTPWTEDPLEAAGEGDIRANVEPDVSPDGRYVIFTNISTSVDETMILRLEIATGEVLNLSAMTAGAVTVRDSAARYSPDGTRIAFSSTVGTTRQLFVMRADGTEVRQLTNEDNDTYDPAWSPDGTSLAFASNLAGADAVAGTTGRWAIVRLDIASGRQQVVTRVGDAPAFRPVWSPDGGTIAYISAAGARSQPDVRLVDVDGSRDRLLVTLLTREAFVDWR